MLQPQLPAPGVFRWIRTSRISLLFVLMILPILPLMGCYGEFALTKSLYTWNGEVSDMPLVQTLVMWVLGFFWIYSLAMLGDLVIFNLVEFWSGENPIQTAKTLDNPDGTQTVMTPSPDGREVRIDLKKEGETLGSRRVVKTGDDHFQVLTAEGQLVGEIDRKADGALELTRPDTQEKGLLTRDMIQQLRAQPALAM